MREISSFRGVLGAPGAAVLVAQELRGGRHFHALAVEIALENDRWRITSTYHISEQCECCSYQCLPLVPLRIMDSCMRFILFRKSMMPE